MEKAMKKGSELQMVVEVALDGGSHVHSSEQVKHTDM